MILLKYVIFHVRLYGVLNHMSCFDHSGTWSLHTGIRHWYSQPVKGKVDTFSTMESPDT